MLKGVYIGDQHHDTLLYAGELSVNINNISTSKKIFEIETLSLTDANFYLRQYHGEEHLNLNFLINYFSSDGVADTSSHKLKLTVANLQLHNARFKYEVEDDTLSEHGIDYQHMDVSNINGSIFNIHFINDSVFGLIKNLSLRERSGFVLNEFNGDAKLSANEMRVNKLMIKTPYSHIQTDLTFNYDSFPDWIDFVEKIRWNSAFRNSLISFTDIAYFAGDYIWGLNSTVKLTGDCKGTVTHFKCKNVTLEYGDQTVFKGNVGLTGLPNIDETYFDILADKIISTKRDLETIPVYPFDSGSHVKLPENITQLGKITIKGKFSGFYNDFVAYGNVNTALGYLSSDINLKYDHAKKKEFYKGHLSSNEFLIGQLIGVHDLGALSFNADVDGSGLRLDDMESQTNGVVSLLQYRGYSYKNINVNGQISKKLFDGSFAIKEPNVDLKFNGQVDFQGAIPTFDFTADINHLHLDTLNLIKLPGEAEISSQLEINFSGNKPDNWEGEVQINNFNYKADKVLYHVNNISINSELEPTFRTIHIKSDFLDGDLKGQFEFQTLANSFTQLVPEYFPALMPDCKRVTTNQDFSFNFDLKNTTLITEIFLPLWYIDPSTKIAGRFNSILSKAECKITSNEVRYKTFRLINENLIIDASSEIASVKSVADRIYYTADSAFMETPVVLASGKMNEVDFVLRLADSSLYTNRGYFKGNLLFASPQKFRLKFNKAEITLQNKTWVLNQENSLQIDSTAFLFSKFDFDCGKENLNLKGIISENRSDTLFFQADNFSLTNLNPILKSSNINVGGVLNGSASISNFYDQLLLVSDLSAHSLAINGDTLGNALVNSSYDVKKKAVHLSMNVIKGEAKTIFIDGDYYTVRARDNLDFDLKLSGFRIAPYERYTGGVVSGLRGKISSDLKLTGTFSEPVFNGTINLNQAGCKVDYLNTTYSTNDKVLVKENYFEFNDFRIHDAKGNLAIANGKIFHNYFSDFRFDVRVDVDKFEGLHTSAAQNDLYYGIAFVTGYSTFNGPIESMGLDMQLKSEKGTEIYIPLGNSEELSRSSYINFINRNDTTNNIERGKHINPSHISLNMNFEITDDASINLIFDEKIGDKITGIGTGNINLTLDEGGNFNIFGRYDIVKGDYLFTMQNIINKHFAIDAGTILWNGDPYNADINLSALYKGGTSTFYKVMPEEEALKQRYHYELVLYLSNKLMNPTINYEISVSGLDAGIATNLRSRLNSEAELTRQFLGLMLLNQCVPRQNGTQQVEGIDAAAGAGSSASELLSNQVSNWLSLLSKDVNLGFNYRAGETYTKEEIEIMFSKTLFNDRLSIEGNVGVANGQGAQAVGQSPQSTIVGDFNAEYSLTRDNRLKLKAFNRTNINNTSLDYISPYTQGIGVFYHRQFNSWKDLFSSSKQKQKELDKPAVPETLPAK